VHPLYFIAGIVQDMAAHQLELLEAFGKARLGRWFQAPEQHVAFQVRFAHVSPSTNPATVLIGL